MLMPFLSKERYVDDVRGKDEDEDEVFGYTKEAEVACSLFLVFYGHYLLLE